jgi:hypothetical protein
MSRERVIVEIENLEQALKLEETVRTGYCDPIAENLVAWIAVEEDLVSSYEKLSKKYSQQEPNSTIKELSEESKNNIIVLHEILKSVEQLGQARDLRRQLIEKSIRNNP